MKILVAGASGYVGTRLLAALVERSSEVVALVRDSASISLWDNHPAVSLVQADLLKPIPENRELSGIDVAFYLVHSMSGASDFAEMDRQAASNFAEAARVAGVPRIIYLGGLVPGVPEAELSAHLASRREVGQLLRGSGAVVQELRASIVLGKGSASFEMVGALVERLPVMVTPKWVSNKAQPIATDDLIKCLISAVEIEPREHEIYEIGGPDVVSYGDIMREYARQRGLRRLMIPVPILTPWLSALWLSLVTPLYAGIGRHLLESIRNPTVVTEDSTTGVLGIHPIGVSLAIARAIGEEKAEIPTELTDRRQVRSHYEPGPLFDRATAVGGELGWYFADWLWRLRGAIDRATGGQGLRKGRPAGKSLAVGDQVDCWLVDEVVPGKKISFRSELRLPGVAWLEFEVLSADSGSTLLQTARFRPNGVLGLAYWYMLWPVHAVVFRGLATSIARGSNGNRVRPGGSHVGDSSGTRRP